MEPPSVLAWMPTQAGLAPRDDRRSSLIFRLALSPADSFSLHASRSIPGKCITRSPSYGIAMPRSALSSSMSMAVADTFSVIPSILQFLHPPPTPSIAFSLPLATEAPWDHNPPPGALVVPTNLLPCCTHALPLRVNIHAAPAGATNGTRSRSALLGPGPPTMAVLPSADSATDIPWLPFRAASVPTGFAASCNPCAGASSPEAVCRACSAPAPAPFFGERSLDRLAREAEIR